MEYKKKRPDLSERALARNSGVSRYFLKKLLETTEEQSTSNLDLQQFLKLGHYLDEKLNLSHFGGQSARYQSNIAISQSSEPSTLKINFNDENAFIILNLTNSKSGILRSNLDKMLGTVGQRTLERLIEYGVVKQDRYNILTSQIKLPRSTEILRQHICNLAKFYDPMNKHNNHISIFINGVNSTGLKKLQMFYDKMAFELNDLLKDTDNHGDIPIFAINCFDSLSHK